MSKKPLSTTVVTRLYKISNAAEHEAGLRGLFYRQLAKGLNPDPTFFQAAIRRVHATTPLQTSKPVPRPVRAVSVHDDVFTVGCPFCGAAPKQQCTNRVTPHDARWRELGVPHPTPEQITEALRWIEAQELAVAA
jgi:hypothetical protein